MTGTSERTPPTGGSPSPGPHRAPDLRLVAPALALWVAAAIGVGVDDPDALLVAASTGAVVAVLSLALRIRAPRRSGAALVVLALACSTAAVGLAATVASAPERRPALLQEASAAHRHLELRAVTTQTVVAPGDRAPAGATGVDATKADGGWQRSAGTGSYEVRLTVVEVGGAAIGVAVPARVFGDAPAEGAPIGATLAFEGTVAATAPEDGTAFLVYPSGEVLVARPPPGILGWADAVRSAFRTAAGRLPGDGAALLPGLAIGDTAALGDDLDAAMKTSALTHLTAVSGANCAIVVGLVMLVGAGLGLSRAFRVAAAVMVLGAFVVLVTPEPSVLRAAVMALLVLLAVAGGRPARGLPVLCLAVMVLLVVDPWLAREYGFVLSVLATGGLLLLAGPLTRALSRWLPVPVAAALAVPVAAQLACQPVLLLLAPGIPTYGVLANMLAGPAAPAATVIGLVACILLPIAPPLGLAVTWAAWLPAVWISGVARFFAGLPDGTLPWVGGVAGVILLAALTIVALAAVLGGGLPRGARLVAGALAMTALASWGGIGAGSAVGTATSRPADWTYGMCDVGQGDATLIRSRGRTALIDTGPEESALTPCLDEVGVDRVDVLVLTHFDLDHVGGARALVGRVDRVLVGPTDGGAAESLLEAFSAGGAVVQQVRAGAHGSLGDLAWEVLWPLPPPRVVEPGNDASVVMLVDDDPRCRERCAADAPRALFLGDLGEEAQIRLLGTGRVGPVDVVKVSHHGSADQSRRLYEAADAPLGLIGVGADNTYGHPAPALLDLLESTGTAVARTDREGLLLVAPGEDGSVALWRERPAG